MSMKVLAILSADIFFNKIITFLTKLKQLCSFCVPTGNKMFLVETKTFSFKTKTQNSFPSARIKNKTNMKNTKILKAEPFSEKLGNKNSHSSYLLLQSAAY